MPLKNNSKLQGAIVLIAVVLVTGAIGAVLSAQMGPRATQGQMGPGEPGQMGPGMMGRGPGMRGGPGMGGPGGPGGPMGLIGRGLHGIDLTEDQRAKIRDIAESHRDEFAAIADRMGPAREALHEAITADAADEQAIRTAAAAVAAVDVDAALLHAKAHAEMFAVLTPEQQKQVKELRTRMQERMKDGRDRIRKRIDQRIQQKRSGPEAV